MKKVKVILSIFLFTQGVFAQLSNDKVLMTIHNEKIYLSEFKNIYNKNNAVPTAEHKSLEEYLELFINYKLKVKEAEEMGLDTSKKFKEELAGYKIQLAQPYLVDTAVGEAIIKEAYNRLTQEISASHILVKLAPNANPVDTLRAYNRVMEYRNRMIKGEDFKKIQAEIHRVKDENVISENLGFFTAFQMVYPFEEAAYKTKIGDISQPVRTNFGYHIVKVWDTRPTRGELRVAHIMVKSNEADTDEQKKASQTKIGEIYDKLKAGESFEKLAQMYSDDKGSAQKGGELPWFGTGRMVPDFEEAAYNLKEIGSYSAPVKTNYGWHIIKLLEKRKVGSYAEEKNNIKQRAQKDGRYNQSKDALISRLKKEYNLNENNKSYNDFIALLNDDFFNGVWVGEKLETSNVTLFTLTDNKFSKKTIQFTQADFAKYLKRFCKKQDKPTQVEAFLKPIYQRFLDEKVIKFEEENLEHKYEQYKLLSKEYRDGILLFDLMDKKVWSKAVNDTIGLQQFYEKNKSNYMWPMRVQAEIYACANEEIAKQTKKLINQRIKNKISSQDIVSNINSNSQLNISLEKNTYTTGEQPILDKIEWKKGLSKLVLLNNKYHWVYIENVLQPTNKTLQEARGLITSDYQTYLEKEWIQSLRSKYTVQINKEVLSEIK